MKGSVVTAGTVAGLLLTLLPADAAPRAAPDATSPIVWVDAQPTPVTAGLAPVASQISRDGSLVDFVTTWNSIDPGDVQFDPDLFEYDVAAGVTSRVNLTPGGVTYGNGWLDSLSADGSVVSLTTGAALTADDTNGTGDVYTLDRATGVLQRVSVDPLGQQSSNSSGPSALSADGRAVAFSGDLGTGGRQIWWRDLGTGRLEAISAAADGRPADAPATLASMSDDGRYVSFWTPATNLPGQRRGARDFYICDRVAATTIHGVPGAGVPESAVMSGDGNVVSYVLDPASDPAPPRSVHVWDRRTNIDRILHVPSPFNRGYDDWGAPIAVSADGRYLLMVVPAPPSARLAIAVAVYDTIAGAIAFPAVDGTGAIVTSDARVGGISADGTRVLFTSWADGIAPGDGNHDEDLFVRLLDPFDFRPVPPRPGLFGSAIHAGARATRIRAPA